MIKIIRYFMFKCAALISIYFKVTKWYQLSYTVASCIEAKVEYDPSCMQQSFASLIGLFFLVNRVTGSDAIATMNWQLCLITLINIFNTMQSIKNVSRTIMHAVATPEFASRSFFFQLFNISLEWVLPTCNLNSRHLFHFRCLHTI